GLVAALVVVRFRDITPPPGPLPEAERGRKSFSPPLRFGEGAGGRGFAATPPLRFGEGAGGRGFVESLLCFSFAANAAGASSSLPSPFRKPGCNTCTRTSFSRACCRSRSRHGSAMPCAS